MFFSNRIREAYLIELESIPLGRINVTIIDHAQKLGVNSD